MAEPPASAIQGAAHRLTGAAADYDPLLAVVGEARFVPLGEASHGTHGSTGCGQRSPGG